KELGPAADIYALGAILYECLTGRPPFKAATPLDTVLQVVSDEPVPPRQLQTKTPKDLETICLRCLQKEPRKRYADALALAEDLGRFQTGGRIQARPVGSTDRMLKWARRRPMVAGLLAAVVLLVIAGTSVSTFFAVEAGTRADEAEKNFLVAEATTKVAEEKTKLAQEKTALADAKTKLAEERTKETIAALHERGLALENEKKERKRANEREEEAKKQLRRAETAHYATQILLAQRELQDGNLAWAEQVLQDCRQELRHWEHRYLEALLHSRMRSFKGLPSHVHSVALSADGKRLATACWRGPATLWDTTTAAVIATFKPSKQEFSNVVFSPDGKRLAAGDGTRVLIWDAGTGKEVLSFAALPAKISQLAFSPDGKRLACVSALPAGKKGTV